jgi:hypothetical protein
VIFAVVSDTKAGYTKHLKPKGWTSNFNIKILHFQFCFWTERAKKSKFTIRNEICDIDKANEIEQNLRKYFIHFCSLTLHSVSNCGKLFKNVKVAGGKGISEMKSKQQSLCSNCMHRPVMSWAMHAEHAHIGLWCACIGLWCHRPKHALTALALLFWFHLVYTFTPPTLQECKLPIL